MTGWTVTENVIFLRRVNYHSEKQKTLHRPNQRGLDFHFSKSWDEKKHTKKTFAIKNTKYENRNAAAENRNEVVSSSTKKTETHWLALPSPLAKDYHGKPFVPLICSLVKSS